MPPARWAIGPAEARPPPGKRYEKISTLNDHCTTGWALLLVLILLSVSSAVRAQSDARTEAQRSAAARSLFSEGVELVDEGDWEAAADRFRRALELRPSPVIRYNLGKALTETGKLVEGVELLRQVARNDTAEPDVREAARQDLEAVEPRLAELTIRLQGSEQGVQVRLDGDPVSAATIGVAQPAAPGAHRIVAMRGDAEVASREVQLEEGGAAEVTLEIPPPEPGSEQAAGSVPDPEQAARAATAGGGGARGGRGAATEESSVLSNGWLWAGVGAAVVAIVGVSLAVTLAGGDGGSEMQPFESNAGVIEVGE